MQIKRFEAKDMQTALRLIKKELGSDAVILSARSLKKENKIIGRAKAVGVEVTAAVDGYHLSAEIKPAIAAGALNNYRRNATNSHETSSKGNFPCSSRAAHWKRPPRHSGQKVMRRPTGWRQS